MLEERGIDLNDYPRIQAREYIDDMALWTAAADLVISRAGAITISELEVLGKPSILVPYPYAAENHQYHNAKVLEDHRAAILVEEKDYSKEAIIERIEELYHSPEKLKELGKNAASLAVYDTTRQIYDRIMEELSKGRS